MAVARSLASGPTGVACRPGRAGEQDHAAAGEEWRPAWFRACAAEIRARIGRGWFREGAWFGEGTLLLVTPRSMLAVRPWGEGAGAWSRALEARVWERARPHLDLGLEYVGERPPRARPRPLILPGGRRGACREAAADQQLLLPFPAAPEHARHNDRVEALARFFAAVPAAVRAQAIRLRPGGQWGLLLFLTHAGEPGLDLCRSNLPLAFMLAECHELGLPFAPDRVRDLVRQKQHAILEQIGFPGEKCVVRIVHKLPDEAIDVDSCRHLRRLMRWRACREAFGHLPTLSPALLRALRQPGHIRLAAPTLLTQLARSRAGDASGTLVADTLTMLDRLRRGGHQLPASVRDLAEARVLHDQLHRLLVTIGEDPRHDQLPLPPLPGVPAAIEPICSARELLREGEEMHHCVGSYLPGVRAKKYAVYRVLAPQRATLALRHTPAGWRLDQLRGRLNRTPSSEVTQFVEDWLVTARAGGEVRGSRRESVATAAEPVPDLPVEA